MVKDPMKDQPGVSKLFASGAIIRPVTVNHDPIKTNDLDRNTLSNGRMTRAHRAQYSVTSPDVDEVDGEVVETPKKRRRLEERDDDIGTNEEHLKVKTREDTAETPPLSPLQTEPPTERQHVQEPIITPKKLKEQDLQVLTTKINLNDIISGQRIKYCCKSTKCSHFGCFDFDSFIKICLPVSYYGLNTLFEKIGKNTKEQRFIIRILNPLESTFQIQKKPVGKFHLNNRKFTTKRTYNSSCNLKCPICNILFSPSELVFDDFMDLLINHPFVKDVNEVEIDDNWIVRPVREKKNYEEKEVVEIEDDEEGEDDDVSLVNDMTLFLANGTEFDPVVID